MKLNSFIVILIILLVVTIVTFKGDNNQLSEKNYDELVDIIDELNEDNIYITHRFDNSKACAYITDYLQKEGFDAYIALNSTYYPQHYWVTIYNIKEHECITIESIAKVRIINNTKYYIPEIQGKTGNITSFENSTIIVYNDEGYKYHLNTHNPSRQLTLINISNGNYIIIVSQNKYMQAYKMCVSNGEYKLEHNEVFEWNNVNPIESIDINNNVNRISEYHESCGIRIPEQYYNNIQKRNQSVENLSMVLYQIPSLHKYEKHVFDCSEMSAYVEWILENTGYNTTFCINNTEKHAWLNVETEEGIISVEGESPILLNDLFMMKTDVEYDNIYDAFQDNPSDWDWWCLGEK